MVEFLRREMIQLTIYLPLLHVLSMLSLQDTETLLQSLAIPILLQALVSCPLIAVSGDVQYLID